VWREIKNRDGEAATLTSLGDVYLNLSQYEKARGYYEQALVIRREIKDRRGEGQALVGLARALRDHGYLSQARAQVEGALPLIESIRTDIAGQELRTSYFASVQNYYGLYIDILMRLHKQRPDEGYVAAALQASERARARSLLELLTEARIEIRQGVDLTLLERERNLRRQLNAKAGHQTRLLSRNHTEQEAAEVNKEIQALTMQYQELQAQIRVASPRYAALTQPQPLTLEQTQQLLDAETLLLEYALGEERSYLWAVTPNSITGHELPGRTEVEAAARRLYDSLSSSSSLSEQKEASAVSRMLLGPLAGQLSSSKRLLIVASGALQYLPFGALPAPAVSEQSGRSGQTSANRPLIVDHEIVSLPSASTLAVLRHELSGRRPAAKTVAVLADPVFDRNDPRVKAATSQVAASRPADLSVSNLERSAREAGLLSFDRLRSTRREADEILALARADEGLKAVDFEASRATAMSEGLGQYRVVHFATHGLLNSQHPELSGMVFSLVDDRGQPQDGFLRAHEVYNLKLGADLVVLSGCQTALGKEVKGEGLLGLTRGFMYAGAPRVVASLWRVPDQATAELMRQFYKGMLTDGLRPAAALRAAQIGMLKGQRWAAPYYWAAFVLQGEWR
jgi:CHAT domain-containing protein